MKKTLAPTPPMGWNSRDCYGAGVTEEALRETARFMAAHLLLFADGRPVGTLRAFTEDGGTRWHIGRVAVIQSARQLHLGRRMMDLAEAELRRRGAAGVEVSAQCRVQPFYEKCGFTPVGEVYLDEFCPHIRMVKEL